MERERRSTGLAFQLTTLAYRSYAYDMERERRSIGPAFRLTTLDHASDITETGAGKEIRTPDPRLGKAMLYH